MKNFKNFMVESTQSLVNPVESMPLYQGHEGVATTADMLEGLHNKLRGKSSSIKTSVNFQGPKITFGIHPNNKQFFVSSGGKDSFSHEEIDLNHSNNPVLKQKLKSAFTNIPKIMPQKAKPGDMYSATLIHTNNEDKPEWLPKTNANMSLSITGDHEGNLLTNHQKSKFEVHPDVYNINPEIRTNPLNYGVDTQGLFLMHMNSARNAYARVDPEAFDSIKGHNTHLSRYITNATDIGDKPSYEGYLDHLKQTFGGRQAKAKSSYDQVRHIENYNKLTQQTIDNEKHFKSVIPLLGHLQNAKNIITDTISKNNNPGDVTVFKGNNRAVLKARKV